MNEKQMEELGMNVLTSKKVNEIMYKENMGMKLYRSEKIWLNNESQVRKPNIKFAMTDSELKEYVKCKKSVFYFVHRYCQIKREDGAVGPVQLRDYQEDILSLYDNNRYSILMASRQIGKCTSFKTIIYIKMNDIIKKISLGELYYYFSSQKRKLNFLEKIKYSLYKLITRYYE